MSEFESFKKFVPLKANKEIADKVLMEFVEETRKLGLLFYLKYGVCLGFVREGGYIEHDNDIDIIVHATYDEWRELMKRLREREFVLPDCDYAAQIVKNKIMLDISRTDGGKHPHEYTVFDKVMYNGVEFYVPHPVEKYLEETYGKDWRVPKHFDVYRRYDEYLNRVKLHLGCGERFIPGFVHIDLGDYGHLDHKHDIKSLPMFEDESVDLIYCSHALQYFDLPDSYLALKEWLRVLKKGGVLRLAVPDFAGITEVYLSYGTIMDGPIYGIMAQGNRIIRHKTMYDFSSLRSLLELVGFRDVKRYDWRKTIHKDYDDFSQAYVPHMDKDNGILISLNVEATK